MFILTLLLAGGGSLVERACGSLLPAWHPSPLVEEALELLPLVVFSALAAPGLFTVGAGGGLVFSERAALAAALGGGVLLLSRRLWLALLMGSTAYVLNAWVG